MLNLSKIKKIHFIGIGGIMMSAVAKYFAHVNKIVTGSDRDQTEITTDLSKNKIKILIGHSESNINHSIDLIIYTQAIPTDNPELQKAKELNIPTFSVYEIMGEISKNKKTIAVTGMHGKSTTTSLLALVLEKVKLDPTVFVGTKIKEWDSNFRFGNSNYLLSEACEYKDNFLNYRPQILVINNIEAEHLDYFKNLEGIKTSFSKLITQTNPQGYLVVNNDDKNIKDIINAYPGKIITFALKNQADFTASHIKVSPAKTTFKLNSTNPKYNNQAIILQVAGEYNIYNALAAISVASVLNIKPRIIKQTLKKFTGSWRRFEYKGKKNGLTIYDDYAHHPTEIKALLEAVKQKFPKQKIWFVFQPHLYSRTHDFLKNFAATLNQAENLIITDIYPAREANKWNIAGSDLAELINENERENPVLPMSDFNKITDYLRQNAKRGDIIFTLGAGEAFKIGENLLK